MSTKQLDRFNTLPARPEYLKKVTSALKRRSELKVADLVQATGMTRTQVMCALEELVRQGKVIQHSGALQFSLAGIPDDPLA